MQAKSCSGVCGQASLAPWSLSGTEQGYCQGEICQIRVQKGAGTYGEAVQ